MPLLYLPLIMYASWMAFMTQPFIVLFGRPSDHDSDVDVFAIRTRAIRTRE